MSTRTRIVLFAVVATLATGLLAPAAIAKPHDVVYKVTLTNLTPGQPLSPAVAVTHRKSVRLFSEGRRASDAIEAIAEDGNQSVAVAALDGVRHVTEVVDVGVPLTPDGATVGSFSSSVEFEIAARPGDRLSLASMLICSNDGFTGIDSAKLPKHGSQTYYLGAHDAGTEANTESSGDIVDPCSGLGPFPLVGDPNGNENAAIDTDDRIRMHPGISGVGDLSAAAHGWSGPVAMLTITVVG